MRSLLIGLAAPLATALAMSAAPAAAEEFVSGSGGDSVELRDPRFVDRNLACGPGGRDRRDHGDRGDRRRDRIVCDVFVPGWYGGEWALYNNRSFEPDSYNDWWHDRPDRALPRWVQDNRNCARVWWGGGGWRC